MADAIQIKVLQNPPAVRLDVRPYPQREVITVKSPGATGPQGEQGGPGPQGQQGDPGPTGEGTDANYVYPQIAPSMVWTITHNLGKYPSVMIVDSGGTTVLGDIEYLSINQIRITFTTAFSGSAYLN